MPQQLEAEGLYDAILEVKEKAMARLRKYEVEVVEARNDHDMHQMEGRIEELRRHVINHLEQLEDFASEPE